MNAVETRLRALGAPDDCFVISYEEELDRMTSLARVLGLTVGRTFGTFISCIPGRLGYFENEDGRWILFRKYDSTRDGNAES